LDIYEYLKLIKLTKGLKIYVGTNNVYLTEHKTTTYDWVSTNFSTHIENFHIHFFYFLSSQQHHCLLGSPTNGVATRVQVEKNL